MPRKAARLLALEKASASAAASARLARSGPTTSVRSSLLWARKPRRKPPMWRRDAAARMSYFASYFRRPADQPAAAAQWRQPVPLCSRKAAAAHCRCCRSASWPAVAIVASQWPAAPLAFRY